MFLRRHKVVPNVAKLKKSKKKEPEAPKSTTQAASTPENSIRDVESETECASQTQSSSKDTSNAAPKGACSNNQSASESNAPILRNLQSSQDESASSADESKRSRLTNVPKFRKYKPRIKPTLHSKIAHKTINTSSSQVSESTPQNTTDSSAPVIAEIRAAKAVSSSVQLVRPELPVSPSKHLVPAAPHCVPAVDASSSEDEGVIDPYDPNNPQGAKSERERGRHRKNQRLSKPFVGGKPTAMIHYLFYNPKANPMTHSQSDRVLSSNREEEAENNPDEPEETAENSLPAPQLTLVNGVFQVDETSLTIERKEARESREALSRRPVTSITGYASSRKRPRRTIWTSEETLFFYKCLNTLGTDFELISHYFPGRDRHQIKLKFKLEDKRNPSLIDRALKCKNTFDTAELDEEYEDIADKAKKLREEKKIRRKPTGRPQNPKSPKRTRGPRHRKDYYLDECEDTEGSNAEGGSTSSTDDVDEALEKEMAEQLIEHKPVKEMLRRIKQETKQVQVVQAHRASSPEIVLLSPNPSQTGYLDPRRAEEIPSTKPVPPCRAEEIPSIESVRACRAEEIPSIESVRACRAEEIPSIESVRACRAEEIPSTESVRACIAEGISSIEPVRACIAEGISSIEPVRACRTEEIPNTEPVRPCKAQEIPSTEPVQPCSTEEIPNTVPVHPFRSEEIPSTEPIQPLRAQEIPSGKQVPPCRAEEIPRTEQVAYLDITESPANAERTLNPSELLDSDVAKIIDSNNQVKKFGTSATNTTPSPHTKVSPSISTSSQVCSPSPLIPTSTQVSSLFSTPSPHSIVSSSQTSVAKTSLNVSSQSTAVPSIAGKPSAGSVSSIAAKNQPIVVNQQFKIYKSQAHETILGPGLPPIINSTLLKLLNSAKLSGKNMSPEIKKTTEKSCVEQQHSKVEPNLVNRTPSFSNNESTNTVSEAMTNNKSLVATNQGHVLSVSDTRSESVDSATDVKMSPRCAPESNMNDKVNTPTNTTNNTSGKSTPRRETIVSISLNSDTDQEFIDIDVVLGDEPSTPEKSQAPGHVVVEKSTTTSTKNTIDSMTVPSKAPLTVVTNPTVSSTNSNIVSKPRMGNNVSQGVNNTSSSSTTNVIHNEEQQNFSLINKNVISNVKTKPPVAKLMNIMRQPSLELAANKQQPTFVTFVRCPSLELVGSKESVNAATQHAVPNKIVSNVRQQSEGTPAKTPAQTYVIQSTNSIKGATNIEPILPKSVNLSRKTSQDSLNRRVVKLINVETQSTHDLVSKNIASKTTAVNIERRPSQDREVEDSSISKISVIHSECQISQDVVTHNDSSSKIIINIAGQASQNTMAENKNKSTDQSPAIKNTDFGNLEKSVTTSSAVPKTTTSPNIISNNTLEEIDEENLSIVKVRNPSNPLVADNVVNTDTNAPTLSSGASASQVSHVSRRKAPLIIKIPPEEPCFLTHEDIIRESQRPPTTVKKQYRKRVNVETNDNISKPIDNISLNVAGAKRKVSDMLMKTLVSRSDALKEKAKSPEPIVLDDSDEKCSDEEVSFEESEASSCEKDDISEEDSSSSDTETLEREFLNKAQKPTRFGRLPKMTKSLAVPVEQKSKRLGRPKKCVRSSQEVTQSSKKRRMSTTSNSVSKTAKSASAPVSPEPPSSSPDPSEADSSFSEEALNPNSMPPPGSLIVCKSLNPVTKKETIRVFMVSPDTGGTTIEHNPDGSLQRLSVGSSSVAVLPTGPGPTMVPASMLQAIPNMAHLMPDPTLAAKTLQAMALNVVNVEATPTEVAPEESEPPSNAGEIASPNSTSS